MRDTPIIQTTGDDPTPPLGWAEFAVQTVSVDHLVCKAFDGTVAYGDDIAVAKMPDLRRGLYHGLTLNHGADIGTITYDYTGPQSRTLTKGTAPNETTQDQITIPAYDEPTAGTGYTGTIILAFPKLTVVGDDIVCQWCEMSNRAWANKT